MPLWEDSSEGSFLSSPPLEPRDHSCLLEIPFGWIESVNHPSRCSSENVTFFCFLAIHEVGRLTVLILWVKTTQGLEIWAGKISTVPYLTPVSTWKQPPAWVSHLETRNEKHRAEVTTTPRKLSPTQCYPNPFGSLCKRACRPWSTAGKSDQQSAVSPMIFHPRPILYGL